MLPSALTSVPQRRTRALPILSERATREPEPPRAARPVTLALRVSVTDRCNFSCSYCRPGTLTPYLDVDRLLSVDAYARIARAFAARAQPPPLTKVRFTGGEPLLRADLPAILSAFREALPAIDLALTTNGVLLERRLPELRAAGLRRATIHVDTLRPERAARLMGPGDLQAVLRTVEVARDQLPEVKVNTVIQRGQNDDEIGDLIDWSKRTGIEVRFIEMMNTGSAQDYTRRTFFSGEEIVAAARARGSVAPLPRRRAADPAALWKTDDDVTFGVIASDTQPFCGGCDRLRLNAEGTLRGCLYQSGGLALGALARAGAPDSDLAGLIDRALAEKRSWHPDVGADRALFSMADVGG